MRAFGDFVAVAGIDLHVPRGSLYGFLGPNGAGKSTTIKCLTGLLRRSGGEVRILGLDPEREDVAVKRLVGVVPEGLALFDRLTGPETLELVARVHGLAPEVAKERAEALLGVMSLRDAGRALVAEYSHGMRKKLALAAALLPAPKLLFLDEPFEGVDAVASRQIKDLLQGFVARGGTVFVTSHVLEIVERLCTHVGVIARGRMVAEGTLDALRADAGGSLEAAFLDLVGGASAAGPDLDWLAG